MKIENEETVSCEFATSIAIQHCAVLTLVTTMNKVTYTLDQVTERGATFRVSMVSRYGTRTPEVSWCVVTDASPYPSPLYRTRKSARRAIEV